MPTNVTTEYALAYKKYLEAKTREEKLKALEEMHATVPKHKGTEKLRAEIKAKIARLRQEIKKKEEKKKKIQQISIKKEGAQVCLLGLPNVGKSLLLRKLTNAKPEVADYDFTTQKPEIGMLEYNKIKIQVIELPALYEGYHAKGKGPLYLSIARNADLIIIVIDLLSDLQLILEELEMANIKLNKKKKNIVFVKEPTSLKIENAGFVNASEEEIKKILHELGYTKGTLIIKERATLNDIVDSLNESLVFIKSFIVFNKISELGALEKLNELKKKYKQFEFIGVDALKEINLDLIKEKIWQYLDLIRVYLKEPGKKASEEPIALKKGSTIKDLAEKLHKDFIDKFDYAVILREHGNHKKQRAGLSFKLQENDVVEFHLKK